MKEKLKKLKKELKKKIELKEFNLLKEEYKNKKTKEKELKIIGITGSRGKSTVAFIVHEYLKTLGYKSILYSSLGIDSPSSLIKKGEATDIPLNSEETLLSIIEEAEKYEADYLVLEINESTIDLVKDMPFDVKVLTNFNPRHNLEQYSEEEYKNLKKSFFENLDEDCICVLGIGSMMSKEDYLEFIETNNNPKVLFGSKHICEVRDVNYQNIHFLLHELDSSLKGLQMQVLINGKNNYFRTSTILSHNALNYVTAMATLYALGVFKEKAFQKCILELKIPGREEVIRKNNRTIVIGMFLNPALEEFKKYQQNKEIQKIKVLSGSIGYGYKTWKEKYKTEEFKNSRTSSRKFAMKELEKYADYVYLTECDNAKESVKDICLELQSYLKTTPSKIILDREKAIRSIILESKENDLIFISGRGNKKLLCYSENESKILKDKDVVENVLKELGW